MAKLEAKKTEPTPTPVEAAPFGACTGCGGPAYLLIDHDSFCEACVPTSLSDTEARWKEYLAKHPGRIR